MTSTPTRLRLLFILVLLHFNILLWGQNQSMYDWFDKNLGRESLDIYNGKLFVNADRIYKTDRFFFSDYVTGTVNYNNQPYAGILLNYDCYQDELILKPNGPFDRRPMIALKENISHFLINNTHFINLSIGYPKNKVASGFYEVVYTNTAIPLYVKHLKKKTDLIIATDRYDDFLSETNFVIEYKSELFDFNTKREVIKALPLLENQIEKFYDTYYSIEKSNKKEFLVLLLQTLNAQL